MKHLNEIPEEVFSKLSNLLAEQYQAKDIKEALYYFKIAKSADDERYSVTNHGFAKQFRMNRSASIKS
jgi:hypothetical protein